MTVVITQHAIDRYIERIAPVSRLEAKRTMLRADRAIEAAAAFGAHVVRLASGARLICTGKEHIRVVTVLDRDHIHRGVHERLS